MRPIVIRLVGVCFILSLGVVILGMSLGSMLPDALEMTVFSPRGCGIGSRFADIFAVDIDRNLNVRQSSQPLDYALVNLSPNITQYLFEYSIEEGTYTVITPDGELGDLADLSHPPSWSPDSEYIAYLNNDALQILQLKTLTLVHDIPFPYRPVGKPLWSPDNQHLVLIVTHPDFILQNTLLLYTLDTQTMHIFDLYPDIGRTQINPDTVQWSPDARTLAFVMNINGVNQLHTLDIITEDLTAIYDEEGLFYNVLEWSPDSEQIAFSVYDTQDFTLHVIDIDGDNERMIYTDTQSNSAFNWISWSPDGQWVDVRFSNQILAGNLVLNVQTGQHRVVSDYTHFNVPGVPSWSADSTQHILHFGCERVIYIEPIDASTQGRMIHYAD